MKIISVFVAVLAAASTTQACTDFLLNTTTTSVVTGRSMDFVEDLRTVVEVIPRNTSFQELPVYQCATCPDYQWTNKYGFVAMNMFDTNVASDGLNEVGLSAAWLYLVATKYPIPEEVNASSTNHDEKDQLPIVTSVCSYLLGNYATVDEVRAALNHDFQVAEYDPRIGKLLRRDNPTHRVPLHVSVHDAQGKSLVIEFINGEAKVYDNVNDVLTNDPPLNEQLELLIQNGYNHSYPSGYSSTARFLRVSYLNHFAPLGYIGAPENASYLRATEEQLVISDTLHILNTVVRPPSKEATEWSLVRDHRRKKLYFQSTANQLLRRIDLNALDFTNSASRRAIPVTYGDWFAEITDTLLDPENHAKTVDLPPREQIEALLEKQGNSASAQGPPSDDVKSKVLDQSAGKETSSTTFTPETVATVACPPHHSSFWTFFWGAVSGAALIKGWEFLRQRSRRTGYRPIGT